MISFWLAVSAIGIFSIILFIVFTLEEVANNNDELYLDESYLD